MQQYLTERMESETGQSHTHSQTYTHTHAHTNTLVLHCGPRHRLDRIPVNYTKTKSQCWTVHVHNQSQWVSDLLEIRRKWRFVFGPTGNVRLSSITVLRFVFFSVEGWQITTSPLIAVQRSCQPHETATTGLEEKHPPEQLEDKETQWAMSLSWPPV